MFGRYSLNHGHGSQGERWKESLYLRQTTRESDTIMPMRLDEILTSYVYTSCTHTMRSVLVAREGAMAIIGVMV